MTSHVSDILEVIRKEKIDGYTQICLTSQFDSLKIRNQTNHQDKFI